MKSLIVANWKMSPQTWKAAKALFLATKKAAERAREINLIVAPPTLYLHEIASSYRGTRIRFAAQNAHWEDSAAHTGEISLSQMKEAGARAVLVGHAERRDMGESNDDTRKKVAGALKQKLEPILCVGEHARTAAGEHFAFIADELRTGLADVSPSSLAKVVIAYEPVWAIGSDQAMSPTLMHEMAIFIRKTLVEAFGPNGHKVKVLYGGAVDAENAPSMLKDGDVAGLLVGRVSTDADALKALLTAIQRA